jgi:hypothetical protein
MLAFYQNELDRQHAIQVFFLTICSKLLLFDIYLTYNLRIISTSYSEKKLVVTPAVYISGIDTWTTVVPLICFEMVELHCPN